MSSAQRILPAGIGLEAARAGHGCPSEIDHAAACLAERGGFSKSDEIRDRCADCGQPL
jgi:hypothetical protein